MSSSTPASRTKVPPRSRRRAAAGTKVPRSSAEQTCAELGPVEQLRALQRRLGFYRPKQLARLLCVAPFTVRRWEAGALPTGASADALRALVDAVDALGPAEAYNLGAKLRHTTIGRVALLAMTGKKLR